MIPAYLNLDAGTASRAEEALSLDPRFLVHPTPAGELAKALRREVREGRERVLVAGGDGTIAAAAHVLAGTGVELAVLPAGTLNHFARDLGIPTNPRSALDLAAAPAVHRVDVGFVNDHVFLNTSSLGFYVDVANRRERLAPWTGHGLSVLSAGLAALVRLPTLAVTLSFGEEQRSYQTPLVFVGVRERDLTLSGFGRRIQGGGAPGLHVIVVGTKARRKLLGLGVATAVRGIWRVSHRWDADSVLVDACRLEVESPVPVALDGEVRLVDSPLDYRLAREALTVVAPPPKA